MNKCQGKVWSGYKWHPCGTKAKVERDGKWYCGHHDPVARAARVEKNEEKRRAEYDAKMKNSVTLIDYASDGSWVKVRFKGEVITYRAVE